MEAGQDVPRISVIVPLYRTEDHIERCLRSIMAQTVMDIEIICIDDCSPDGSAAIVERLQAEDGRIMLLRHDRNRGSGGARNSGIRAARAAYLACVDSDDHVAPDFLERLWEGARDGHFDIVVCGYAIVDQEGTVVERVGAERRMVLDPIPPEKNPLQIAPPAPWNKLWRRALFVDNDIWFPEKIYHQDAATTPRIFARARNVHFIGGSSYNYVLRPGSVTNSHSDKHMLDRYRYVDVLKDFFIREGSYDQLAAAIENRIYSGYAYTAESLANDLAKTPGADRAETDAVLRHMLLMREAYLEHDMMLRGMSFEEKLDLLVAQKPIPRKRSEVTTEAEAAAVPAVTAPAVADASRPLPESPSVMVLTLHAGEQEFEAGCAALESQSHRNREQRVFRGMGNHAGHRALYRCIMDCRATHDLFIKLDADMVMADRYVIGRIIGFFRRQPALDHLVVGCADYMTGETILGVHCFSNRVSWSDTGMGLFNDPEPDYPGQRRVLAAPETVFFHHAPNPDSLQAFHFGAHRALKLVQRDLPIGGKVVAGYETQWRALAGLWRQYRRHGDRRHALALVAADMVIGGRLGEGAHDYADPGLIAAHEAYAGMSGAELAAVTASHWQDADARERYFRQAVGEAGLQALAAHGLPEPGWFAPEDDRGSGT